MRKILLVLIAFAVSLSINAASKDTIKYVNSVDSIKLTTKLLNGSWFYGADLIKNNSNGLGTDAYYFNVDSTYLKIDTLKFVSGVNADQYLYYDKYTQQDTLAFIHVLKELVNTPSFSVNGKTTLNIYEGSNVNIALSLNNDIIDIDNIGITYANTKDTAWYSPDNFPAAFSAKDTVKFKIGIKNRIPGSTSKWSSSRTVNVTPKLEIINSKIEWTKKGVYHSYPGANELVDSTIIGETVALSLSTKNGNTSSVKYTWTKDNNPLFTKSGDKVEIVNFKTGDYGKYVCTVTDDSLTVNHVFTISKPVIPVNDIKLTYISNEVISYGNGEYVKKVTYDSTLVFTQAYETYKIDFIVHVLSTYNPTYIWTKDEIILSNDSILTLTASEANFGKYICYVSDNSIVSQDKIIKAEFEFKGLITGVENVVKNYNITNGTIYSITGKLVKSNVHGYYLNIINDNELSPGIYILKTDYGTSKFIKK